MKYKPGTLLCISKVMEGGIAKQKKKCQIRCQQIIPKAVRTSAVLLSAGRIHRNLQQAQKMKTIFYLPVSKTQLTHIQLLRLQTFLLSR